MADDANKPAGGQPSNVQDGDPKDTEEGRVPYSRFQTVNTNWRETQEQLAMKEQENQNLQQQLASIEQRMAELESKGVARPDESQSFDESDEYVDPYTAAAVRKTTKPLAEGLTTMQKQMEQVTQYVQTEAQRRAIEQGARQLDQHFSQRAAQGFKLSEPAKEVMRSLWLEKVIPGNLMEVVSLEDVEATALGMAQRMEFEANATEARNQAQDQGQRKPPSNPGMNTAGDLPPSEFQPSDGADEDDPWKTIGNNPDWEKEFLKQYGNRPLAQDAAPFEEDIPFEDVMAFEES